MARSTQPYDGADPVNYPLIARKLVLDYHVDNVDETLRLDDVYVVMFTYVLGNWKALVSTTVPNDYYYEVTHDKEKNRSYVDVYEKLDQVIHES